METMISRFKRLIEREHDRACTKETHSYSHLKRVVVNVCTVSISLKLYTLIGLLLMRALKIRVYEIVVVVA